ncbi:hypothetical protein HPB50_005084 [Hyalomma asiaticum]|uniref:Uncharacterized protein n=1 Tax=Hyalomma asiaticum TaxID=266040 RepID=A0ACB7T193_HYAAI|nr:hypothetical protein HPB50_005084 [Hyalomma asiaticum]
MFEHVIKWPSPFYFLFTVADGRPLLAVGQGNGRHTPHHERAAEGKAIWCFGAMLNMAYLLACFTGPLCSAGEGRVSPWKRLAASTAPSPTKWIRGSRVHRPSGGVTAVPPGQPGHLISFMYTICKHVEPS